MINNYFETEYQPFHEVYTHESGHKIYLGDVGAAMDNEFIQDKQITFVVTAALGMQHISYKPPIQHIVYPLLDKKTQNMTTYFPQFYQLTQKQIKNTNILVHCFAGISRSATLVISYLMKKQQWSFKDAISFVRKSKPNVLPNLGFQRQLKEYEKHLQNQQKVQVRKTISKTSESRKYNSKQNKVREGLPQIMAFGKTIIRSKILQSPGSQMEQRRARLPQFIDPVPEQKKNPNYELKNIAMKSYRKRSISQAHNKKLHSGDKIDILDSRNGDRIMRVGPAFNQIKFPTQRRIRQNVHPYKGY